MVLCNLERWWSNYIKKMHRKRTNSPLLGRDNRFFACLSTCAILSLGLLWDLGTSDLVLASSVGFWTFTLDFCFTVCVFDGSSKPTDLLDEESQPSEWEGPVIWVARFGWILGGIDFVLADLNWGLISFLSSIASLPSRFTPSLILVSRKRFSQGRTAIHLSNQFQPQLLLSGSYPEETACCLDPACHCNKEKEKEISYAQKGYWKKN